jgi:hypothetical protein
MTVMNKISLCFVTLALLHATSSPAATADTAPSPAMDAAARGEVIDALIHELNTYYVFPDVAKKLETALRDKQRSGGYDSAVREEDLAVMLTADLREVGRDRHLGVRRHDAPPPDAAGRASSAPDEARILARVKELNYGIDKVEKLPGNIGYLAVRGFVPIKYAEKAISAAMTELADSDALIVDMRGNGGGDPAGVAYLTSYLFDKRTHLNDLYFRDGDRTKEYWTTEEMPGRKYGQQKAVYVLTGPQTFSGGEEFSYNLQQLKRATLIGETTGGGANPGETRQLNQHFSAFVPNGRAINPITRTNWEHTGVVPDVKTPNADALLAAQKMALERLAAAATEPQHAQALRARIAQLDHAVVITPAPNKTGG